MQSVKNTVGSEIIGGLDGAFVKHGVSWRSSGGSGADARSSVRAPLLVGGVAKIKR